MGALPHFLRHLASFLVCLCLTSSTDLPLTSHPVPMGMRVAPMVTKHDVSYSSWTHADVRLPDPAGYSERLDISLVQSATSWLEIRWKLISHNSFNFDNNNSSSGANSTNVDGNSRSSSRKDEDENHLKGDKSHPTPSSDAVPLFTRLRCHRGNVTTFYRVVKHAQQYRIPNLDSNTRYVICVEMTEWARPREELRPPGDNSPPPSSLTSHSSSSSTAMIASNGQTDRQQILHFRCVHFRTIPLVRPDSILGLLLTLGYILVMGMMGYVTWWMRVRRRAASRESGNHKYENDMELSCRTSTIRFSEIEERAHLNSSNQSQTT